MKHFTGLSFIICYREEEDVTPTLASIRDSFSKINLTCNYQILTVTGNHPSLQRNVVADNAHYSHLYFLDNDSILNPQSLQYAIARLNSFTEKLGKEVLIMGGPSLLSPETDNFENSIDGLLTSYPVVGRRYARYIGVGETRDSDAKELILCNMIVSKKCFIDFGRFDYRLYPNEENEFINRVQKSGGGIIYAPQMSIHRHQRQSYQAFIKQMINYGRGKAEQLKIELTSAKFWGLRFSHLVMTLVVVGLLGSLAYEMINKVLLSSGFLVPTSPFSPIWVIFKQWLPHLGFWYFIYVLWMGSRASIRKRKLLLHFPMVMVLGHLVYGLSFNYHLLKNRFKSEKKMFWFKTSSSEDIGDED